MLHRVGKESGLFLGDLAEKPWAWVLLSYAAIRDDERIQDRLEELREIAKAQRTAIAFHDPSELWKSAQRARAQLAHRDPEAGITADELCEAREIADRIAAAEAKRLTDGS